MDIVLDAFTSHCFATRVASVLACRSDRADVRRHLLSRATTDGLGDRRLFIGVLCSLDRMIASDEAHAS